MSATVSRENLAEQFRQKADESLLAARTCLTNGMYRAACNRSWYTIYQSICAGTYARLTQDPPSDTGSWKHNALHSLFHNFLRHAHLRIRHGYLLSCMQDVLEARILADYKPDQLLLTAEQAEDAVATAEQIHDLIWKICEWTTIT